ncbi:flagellar hook-associated protein FlgK [Yersinia enterocolitica]
MSFIYTAFSGSQAAQANLTAVAMNTANTLTKGYSRQIALQSAIASSDNLSAGNGVRFEGFQRLSDDYLIRQEWNAISDKYYYEAKSQYLDKIEKTISNTETSIISGFDQFYNSLSSLSVSPDSIPSRIQFINDANSLAMRFNSTNRTIENQNTMINNQRGELIKEINTLTKGIASDNKKIEKFIYNGGNVNTLLDQRDQKIRDLSQLAEVNITKTDRGYLNVSLKDGSPLVDGMGASTLEAKMNNSRFDGLQVKYANSTFDVSSSCGSQLGGINDYQLGILQDTQNKINNIAEQFVNEFNAKLNAGFDLNGAAGADLFIYDSSNPNGALQITAIVPEHLALAGVTGALGDNTNIAELISVRSKILAGLGNNSLNDSGVQMVSNLVEASRENKQYLVATGSTLAFSILQRESVSSVEMNEEGKDLIGYQNLYQANVRVMNVGNQLFTDLLALL